MKEDGALFDSGFDDTGRFRVTPESGAVSLESALRDFGPAAIDDLIPRLRTLAASLDAAHRAGIVHGALHPSKVFVTDSATSLVAGKGARAPYAAPEVLEGHGATPMSDQFALAAIAFEWLFGRPLSHHGERPVDVRSMPGVDRLALSTAFTRALAPKPDDRFASCTAFCDALSGAVVPELPLLADVDDFASEDEEIPAAAVLPVVPAHFDSDRSDALIDQPAPNVDDIKIVAEESNLTAAQPDLDAIDPRLTEPEPAAVPGWSAGAITAPAARRMESPRFGPLALFFAVIVGAVFGFAAGYMARPRALQSGAPQEITVAPVARDGSEARAARDAREASEAREAREARVASAPRDTKDPPAKRAAGKTAERSPASSASPAPAPKIGRLLVRSTPSGASVTIDGVARGETPLALRDLDPGTRTIVVARRGYAPETRRVVITKARPARTLDVRLASEAPRPSTPATFGKSPAAEGRSGATTGSLSVDSRPVGAAVTINGKPSGTTPLTLDAVAPGEYRIVMAMPGFHNFTTTVRVVAGERVRAAASLTALEQQ